MYWKYLFRRNGKTPFTIKLYKILKKLGHNLLWVKNIIKINMMNKLY